MANNSQEQSVATHLYEKILRADYLETPVLRSGISAQSLINGDILLVSRTPNDHLHVLLGDFSAHSNLVSIAASPVAEIFYGMTAKGFEIVEIVAEINRKLFSLLPETASLATTIVALCPDSKALQLISCGFSEIFLLNQKNDVLRMISSHNTALGINSTIEISSQFYEVNSDDYLYLLTDAVYEVENLKGEKFGAGSIIDCIKQQSGDGFENLQSALTDHCNGVKQSHNMAYLELVCDVDNVPWRKTGQTQDHEPIEALNWKTMMEFDINALRRLNPVPVMVNVLMEIQGLQQHQQSIFMIVTELFANALDHGVLKLDSSIKQTPEGFMLFYELKTERLQILEEGSIRIFMAHQATKSGGQLTIKVVDSGDGFNYSSQAKDLDSNTDFSGRGIGLLESLCSRLTYHGKGNRVTAVFEWDQ